MASKLKEYVIILVLIGFFAYLPSLLGGFVWDDEDFVTQNAYVQQAQIGRFFTENAIAGRGKTSDYYRPVQFSLYSLLYKLAGPSPFVFHLASLSLHLAAASLVLLVLASFMPPLPAFLAALLFLVHPVQTESVSYVSGLSDQLYSCFFFGSILVFLRRKTGGWSASTLASLGLFVLAVLSKELGIILPGILAIIVLLKHKTLKKDASVLAAFFAAAAAYLLLRFTVLKFSDISLAWKGTAYGASFLTRLATFFHSFFLFLGLLVFPAVLHMERDYTTPVITNIINVWTVLFVLLNVCVIYFLWRKREIGHIYTALIFWILFVASLVPYTGVFLLNGLFYEHYLYLPMIFFFAFAVSLAAPYLNLKWVRITFAIIVSLFIMRSYARQWDWIDNERFYRQTLTFAPKSIRIINGLAMTLAEKNDCTGAIPFYDRALKLDPKVPNLYHNRANCERDLGRFGDAEKDYQEALKVNPGFYYSSFSLLELYLQTNRKDKAKAWLENDLLKRFPDNAQLRAVYGQL